MFLLCFFVSFGILLSGNSKSVNNKKRGDFCKEDVEGLLYIYTRNIEI